MSREQRTGRRVPIDCPAKIRTDALGPTSYGTCVELSVGGMTLRTIFVPLPGEEFEVTIRPPRGPGVVSPPMTARVKVKRCHEMERGKEYEIGVEIIKILG